MADHTVAMPPLKDVTGMYIFLYTKAGVLVNTGGDLLTLVPSSGGVFAFTVSETISGYPFLRFDVHESSIPTAANMVWFSGSLVPGVTECRDAYPPYALEGSGGGGGGAASTAEIMIETTIATLASQTQFTLTAGSPDNFAYADCIAVLTDAATVEQKSKNVVASYVGATKTVTLQTAPVFTIQVGDSIAIIASGSAGGSGGSSGTGARTVTITVNDGTSPLQNVVVRLTDGGQVYTALTNVSGVAVFNLNDATYTVALGKTGYSYAGTTIVVDSTETVTYSMTAISITPGAGDFTTGYLVTYDETGEIESGVSIYSELTKAPRTPGGMSYDSKITTNISDVSGLVEIPGLVKGGTYRIWRGQRKASATDNLYVIPTSAGATYELPSHIGRE